MFFSFFLSIGRGCLVIFQQPPLIYFQSTPRRRRRLFAVAAVRQFIESKVELFDSETGDMGPTKMYKILCFPFSFPFIHYTSCPRTSAIQFTSAIQKKSWTFISFKSVAHKVKGGNNSNQPTKKKQNII